MEPYKTNKIILPVPGLSAITNPTPTVLIRSLSLQSGLIFPVDFLSSLVSSSLLSLFSLDCVLSSDFNFDELSADPILSTAAVKEAPVNEFEDFVRVTFSLWILCMLRKDPTRVTTPPAAVSASFLVVEMALVPRRLPCEPILKAGFASASFKFRVSLISSVYVFCR